LRHISILNQEKAGILSLVPPGQNQTRCRDIVKGLLDFSRQSNGNTEAVDLNKGLQYTLSLIGKQAFSSTPRQMI